MKIRMEISDEPFKHRIYDAETGAELDFVQRVTFTIGPETKFKPVATLDLIAFRAEATAEAELREVCLHCGEKLPPPVREFYTRERPVDGKSQPTVKHVLTPADTA